MQVSQHEQAFEQVVGTGLARGAGVAGPMHVPHLRRGLRRFNTSNRINSFGFAHNEIVKTMTRFIIKPTLHDGER